MSQTIIPQGNSLAVTRFSVALAHEASRASYFDQRFVAGGEDPQTPIQMLTDLESMQGDKVTFDLFMNLKAQPVEGDNRLAGAEESLTWYTDSLFIDQMRSGVNCGGKMTAQRTEHDLRKVALPKMKDYWGRVKDELFFLYLSGARGVDTDWVLPTTYTGFAGNSVTAPDTQHLIYGGTATSKATVTSSDKMTLQLVEKAVTKARTMGGGTSGVPALQPCKIDGKERFVLVMHEFQAYDLRRETGTGGWFDIQKQVAAAQGENNPVYKDSLGMIRDVILHMHRSVVGFSDYGAGSNLPARRALFLGRQAGVVAYGSKDGKNRFNWGEELDDRGNERVLFSGVIHGIKKTTYNSLDYGVLALDTYAIQPY